MKDNLLNREDYHQDYLPWANELINGKPAGYLIRQVQSDRDAVINSTVLFQPPLNEFRAELELPPEETKDEENDLVTVAATFENAQLRTFTIKSLKNYFVVLDASSSQWPVRYGDRSSRKVERLVKNADLRADSEELVVRTSAALLKHVVHRVPIGDIPEEAFEWTIDEGDLQLRTLNALHAAGISTYGDLGILSINQLMKIKGLWFGGVEDIKDDLERFGWLSSGHKKT